MASDTRKRLLETSRRLFAEHGYRGASVRDLCNQAGANPGAVSYHFGGKRHLYRAVLRQAAQRLASGDGPPAGPGAGDDPASSARRIVQRLRRHPTDLQLVVRDLADGGEMAAETLVPTVREALAALAVQAGEPETDRGGPHSRRLLIRLAAPIALAAVATPVLQRILDLGPEALDELILELLDGSV